MNTKNRNKPEWPGIAAAVLLILTLLFSFSACGSRNLEEAASTEAASSNTSGNREATKSAGKLSADNLPADPDISASLIFQDTLPLDYAERFRIFEYQDGYTLIGICDGTQFLIVPDGHPVPADLDSSITVLQQPIDSIYLAGSSCMDMFVRINALESISLSGMQSEKWHIPEAREAMENGSILYAGKYNIPDYELILSRSCDLAIENTMILHTPEVREQLMKTGIPVLIDHSSYETHPLGRTEWVKLYGVLTGHKQEALDAFNAQKETFEAAVSSETTGSSIAFFAIRPNGSVTVRKSTDYVPAMIRLAGGSYLPDDLSDGSITSTTTLQMEEFCQRARDADCLIYNGAIEGEITSISELLAKAPAMKTFPAVNNGRVWYTDQNLYQSSMETGAILADFHAILTNPDGSGRELHYLRKLAAETP